MLPTLRVRDRLPATDPEIKRLHYFPCASRCAEPSKGLPAAWPPKWNAMTVSSPSLDGHAAGEQRIGRRSWY